MRGEGGGKNTARTVVIHACDCYVLHIGSPNQWRYGQSCHILQASRRLDYKKRQHPYSIGHGMAQVSALIRIHPILYHAHSGKPLVTTQTCVYTYTWTTSHHLRRDTCPLLRFEFSFVSPFYLFFLSLACAFVRYIHVYFFKNVNTYV